WTCSPSSTPSPWTSAAPRSASTSPSRRCRPPRRFAPRRSVRPTLRLAAASGLEALSGRHGPGAGATVGRRARAAARTIRRRRGGRFDADVALGRTLDRLAEAGFRLGDDLELGLAVEDADLTDVLLGHVAQAADQRDQPLGVGVVLPADRHAEPLGAE